MSEARDPRGPAADAALETATWLAAAGEPREALRVRRCRLEVLSGPDAGHRATFGAQSLVIGRAGADLVLHDRRVSGLHAELRFEASGYRLRDLGSTNGTFVQGVRVVEAYLPPMAVLSLGESTVRFVPLPDSVALPLWEEPRLGGLLGRSPAMRELFERIDRIAGTDSTVLISGETGTGKELVAEALHERSPRARGPFVVVDCGAIAPQLMEDQLFGHAAGAFTGAGRARAGLFAEASGGTLFLDEIGELPLALQPRLLRAVETRRVRPLGSDATVDCDVRLVAATNRDLAVETNRGSFRADLYHRLAVVRLQVPPLRERPEDLELLIEHFWRALHPPRGGAAADPGPPPPELLPWAQGHGFPGNVRELRNAVEHAAATRRFAAEPEPLTPAARIEAERRRAASGAAGAAGPWDPGPTGAIDLAIPFKEAKRRLVDDFDRRYAEALMAAHDGNVSAAARAAGLDRMSMYKLFSRLGLRGRRGPEGD